MGLDVIEFSLSFSVSCEVTARRQPSASQEEASHQELNLPVP